MEAAGGKCVFSSEIDEKARLTYHANFGEWPSGDITKIQADDVPGHDILCAGFPCQSFSLCGNQKGFEDKTRGTIFFELTRIIAAKKPAVVFLENVPNLLKHDKGRTFAVIQRALEDIGYFVFHQVLNASLYGSPTARKRVFIVAFRHDLGICNFEFPKPTLEQVKLADVLMDDSETDRWVIRNHQITIDDELVAKTSGTTALKAVRVGYVGATRKAKQGYRVYGEFGHAVTFCAHGGGMGAKSGLYYIHSRVRRLHPRECLRVMGYPDSFVIPSSISADQVRTLAGNSVAVPVVRRICEAIVAALSEARQSPRDVHAEQSPPITEPFETVQATRVG
jgi:DNA (cytosine-5)-methyltransferase 1